MGDVGVDLLGECTAVMFDPPLDFVILVWWEVAR